METDPPSRLPRWRTLRVRVTVIASLVITTAVMLGLVLLYLLQIQSVHRTLDDQLRAYAAQIAQSGSTGTWPAVLRPSTLDANAEAQVVAADGHVLAATRPLAGLPAVYSLPENSATPVRLDGADRAFPGDTTVIGIRQDVAGQTVTIIAGTPTTLLTQLRTAFTSDLLFGLPVILLVAAAAVWLIVGRALRPVQRIRLAVTAITSADLSQRVPEPGTPDEIGYLARTMNDMLDRLDSAARRQRRFVADASHELRSPLAAIRTTLEVGLAHPDRAPWSEIAERAAQQSDRLEALVHQLLLLAKADERLLAVRRQPVDLGPLLADIRATTVGHHRTIELTGSGPAVTAGDPDNLRRLFSNIVDNAVRYADSAVSITYGPAGDRIVVEISDDGPGIPVEDRDRVFDRFVRLDSSRDRSDGTTGLGLAIAREITTAHHGAITVADGPRRGARFVIDLPRLTANEPAAPGDAGLATVPDRP